MILKRLRFPMQGDTEIVGRQAGMLRREYLHMQNAESLNPEQIRQFLELSESVEFAGQSRAEIYAFVEGVLVAQQ
jgi:hypothetical protein